MMEATQTASVRAPLDVPLCWREKISYGMGEVANNLSWTMVGGFLLYYYTNVALLPAVALGTLMFVSLGLDAFFDPVVGLMMDRTNTRFGRAKPYLLFGSIPMGILAVLTFTSPLHSTFGKLVYAYLTLLVLGALFSLVSIPYGALMPMMTKDTNEKVQLGSFRSVGSSVGAVAVTSMVLPMVKYFGHGDAQSGFTVTALLFAVLGTLLYTIVYFNTKERYVELMDRKAPPMLESISQVFRNEIFVATGAFTLIHLVRIGSILTLTVYFALLILKAPWTIPFLFGAMSVGSVVSASMATVYFNRFGFRKGNTYVLVFALACYCVLPFTERKPVLFLIGFCVACMGAQACTTAIFAMVASAADYHEFKFLSRCDGLIFSCFSLSTKVGIAMGSAMIAFGLGIAHYDAKLITPHAVSAVRIMFYLVPIALMLLQILAVQFYRTDTKHSWIVRSSMKRAADGEDSGSDSISLQSEGGIMAEKKSNLQRGVTLYSFQQEYYLGLMSLEDCVAKSAEFGAYGIEILSEQMLPGFPNYSDAVYEGWHKLMQKYGTTPTCHDMFYDSKRFKGQLMPDDEAVESLKFDLNHASRLGCRCIRVIVTTPIEVVERCIEFAEKVDVRMLLEIHSPFHFDHEHIQKHFAVYERSGSGHVGFMPDMGIFVEHFPRVISDRFLRDGATPAHVDRILQTYDERGDLHTLPQVIQANGGNGKDLDLAKMAGHFVYSDPRRLLDFMPWIHHVHGKFYDMTPECIEPSIPYPKVIPVLAEGGFDGFISAEYEGQRHIQDAFEVDSVEQVRRYQEMLKSLIAKVQ